MADRSLVTTPPTPSLTGTADTSASTAAGTRDVIVVFKQGQSKLRSGVLGRVASRARYSYSLIPAVAANVTAEEAAALASDASVEYVEPDPVAHASADTVNWNMTKVAAPRVWPSGNTGVGSKVCVIDTGVDYRHVDLRSNYKGGWNFVARNRYPLDDNGHGTHVAGIIAAAANGTGIEGVAPGASLYACKVLNAAGSGSYSNIIAALQWCVTNKMQIASMSLGSTSNSRALHDACDAAAKAGVLLVAAAGNSGVVGGLTNSVEYPAAFSSVIAVAAIDSNNVRASWSSTGSKVELAAPGVSINSDKLGGGLTSMSGTSMACPHVSGVAALVIASGVTSPGSVRQRLDGTATDLGAAGRDARYGFGLVNALKACNQTNSATLVADATDEVRAWGLGR